MLSHNNFPDKGRYTYYDPYNLAVGIESASIPDNPLQDWRGNYSNKADSAFDAGDFTFGMAVSGISLTATRFLPGIRRAWGGSNQKFVSKWAPPETVYDWFLTAGFLARKLSANLFEPLHHAISQTDNRSNYNFGNWMFSPIQTFREWSTNFKSSFNEARNIARGFSEVDSPLEQVLSGFRNLFEKYLDTFSSSQSSIPNADLNDIRGGIQTLMQEALFEGGNLSRLRHLNVDTAARMRLLAKNNVVITTILNNSTTGGLKEAVQEARGPINKLRLQVDRILSYAGLDKSKDFRQATLDDLVSLLEREYASLNGINHLSGDQQKILTRVRSQLLNIKKLKSDLVNANIPDFGEDVLGGLGLGRGFYMMQDELVDFSSIMPRNIASKFLKSINQRTQIPFLNTGPLNTFQYHLLRTATSEYYNLSFMDSSSTNKGIIIGGQFLSNNLLDSDTKGRRILFSREGQVMQSTQKMISRLVKTPSGPQFMGLEQQTFPIYRGAMIPLTGAVQRMLVGQGLTASGMPEDQINQRFMFSQEHRNAVESMAGQRGLSGWKRKAFTSFYMAQPILGLGSYSSLNEQDYGALTLLSVMGNQRKGNFWSSKVGGWLSRTLNIPQPSNTNIDTIQAMLRDRPSFGDALRSGIIGRIKFDKTGISGDELTALDNLESAFGTFFGQIDTISMDDSFVTNTLGFFSQSPRLRGARAQTIRNELHRIKSGGGSIEDFLVSPISDVFVGSTSKQNIFDFIQQSVFNESISGAIHTRGLTPLGRERVIGKIYDVATAFAGSNPESPTYLRTLRRGVDKVIRGAPREFSAEGVDARVLNQISDMFSVAYIDNAEKGLVTSRLASRDATLTGTLRRLLPFSRSPIADETGILHPIQDQSRDLFMVGERTLTRAFVDTKTLAKMGALYLFERPFRIRGRLLGERAPVGNIISPFRGLGERLKSGMGTKEAIKQSFVGSVLLNQLTDVALLGTLLWAVKPGGLIDTATGGVAYDALSASVAGLGTAASAVRNITPIGSIARYLEDLMPKSMTSPLTKLLGGSAFIYGGLKMGSLLGSPIKGAGIGIAAALVAGFSPLDSPTSTISETASTLYGEEEIPHRSNRWWMIGSTPFEGQEPLFYRPHAVAQIAMGDRAWDFFGGGAIGAIRHLLFTAPLIGQAAQVLSPHWAINARPEEMAYMESGVPLTYFPAIGPTLAIALQIASLGTINKTLSKAAKDRINLLLEKKVKPINEQEFAIYMGINPYSSGDIRYLAGLQIKQVQEWLGLYGFLSELALGQIGKLPGLGFLETGMPFLNRPVLESSLEAWNSTRRFYEMNLGDPGFSIPVELGMATIQTLPEEMMPSTEYLRRFLIKRPSEVGTVNIAPNPLYEEGLYPEQYFVDFSTGSDYSRFPYYSDLRGFTDYARERYDLPEIATRMAPFSSWTSSIVASLEQNDPEYHRYLLDQLASIKKRIKVEPYKFLNFNNDEAYLPMRYLKEATGAPGYPMLPIIEALPDDVSEEEIASASLEKPTRNDYTFPEDLVGGAWEVFTHGHSIKRFFWEKGYEQKTALEEYEERGIYGMNYAQWENPIETFFAPMFYQNISESPMMGALRMGSQFSMFTRGTGYKIVSGIAGGAIGLAGSSMVTAGEMITGDPFIPQPTLERRRLEQDLDTAAYLRKETSALGYLLGEDSLRSGRPPLEKRLFADFRKTEGEEREVILSLLPERLAAQLDRDRYDLGEVKDRALEEYYSSEIAQADYTLDKSIPFDSVKAALVNRGGFSPYSFNIFPDSASLGQVIDEEYYDDMGEGPLLSKYEINSIMGTRGITSGISGMRGASTIRAYNRKFNEEDRGRY